jgi:hypothetical protein
VVVCLAIGLALGCWVDLGAAGEKTFDTGRLRIVVGRPGGGFVDEVRLDLDGDGAGAADEQVALRPDGEPAVVIQYAAIPEEYEPGTVAAVEPLTAAVAVKDARVAEADGKVTATVTGTLDFGAFGTSPFSTTVAAEKGSAILVGGLEFAPPPNAERLMLISAGLRVFGRYMPWDPKKHVRAHMAAAGIFRNTPRPDDAWQPMTWQRGGRLVESPVYWREWKAWSDACSPLTMAQGRVPDRLLTFHMCDPRQGMIVALKHPALTAPN